MSKQYRLSYIMYAPCKDTEDMYMAEVPALPGCPAWAETPEEALEILESLAANLIESYLEDGDPLPPEIASEGKLVAVV